MRKRRLQILPLNAVSLSSQNFAKAFKMHFGASPKAVRQNMGWSKTRDFMANIKSFGSSIEHTTAGHPRWPELAPLLKKIAEQSPSIQPINPRIVELPSSRVAYIRTRGDDHVSTNRAFEELFRWGLFRGLINEQSALLFVLWDEATVTPKEKRVIDVCLTVPDGVETEGRINTHVLPEGRYAVHHCEAKVSDLEEVWTRFVMRWLPSSGYRPATGPKYMFFDNKTFVVNDYTKHPAERMVVLDLYLPIKPL